MPCSSSSLALLPNESASPIPYQGYPSAVTMLLVAPLPNQRLDLDFHFEERTSATTPLVPIAKNATLHAAFGTLSIRQRIVAHAVRRLLHRSFVLVVVHNSTHGSYR
jgi:hypothetical protein